MFLTFLNFQLHFQGLVFSSFQFFNAKWKRKRTDQKMWIRHLRVFVEFTSAKIIPRYIFVHTSINYWYLSISLYLFVKDNMSINNLSVNHWYMKNLARPYRVLLNLTYIMLNSIIRQGALKAYTQISLSLWYGHKASKKMLNFLVLRVQRRY